jgi:Domain of unknown function (DUF4440)
MAQRCLRCGLPIRRGVLAKARIYRLAPWNVCSTPEPDMAGRRRVLDKKQRACNTTSNGKREEPMQIDRRQLVLPALAIGFLGIVPAFAGSADEDAVAKNVEAFRVAQFTLDAKGLDALCATELSYSHSDARVEDKATFIKNATTNRNAKALSLKYQDPKISIVGPAAIVRFNWVSESEAIADGKKSTTKLHVLMNWQKQGADWKLLSRAATKL